nr:unnamed protein product [Callosobruchus chinensis]
MSASSKRRRDFDVEESHEEMSDMLRRLEEAAREAQSIIQKTPNTKAEIKKAVSVIAFQVGKINRRYKERETQETKPIKGDNSGGTESGTQTTLTCQVTTGTQTDSGNCTEKLDQSTQTVGDEEARGEEAARTIREDIDRGTSYDDFLKISSIQWPPNVYRKVKEETGDIMAAPWEQDLINMTTTELTMVKGMARRFRERYGGIEELKSQRQALGEVAYMVNTIRIPTEQGEGRKERFIWHMLVEDTPLELSSVSDLYKSALKLKDLMLLHNRDKVAIADIETYGNDIIGKVFEYVFRDTSIEVTIYRKQKTKKVKSGEGAETTKGKRRSERHVADAVIVKAQGKTYAELVCALRKDVKLEDIEVSRMRKTHKGDLLLEVKKGNAEKLRETIVSQSQGTQVIKKTQETVIHIYGMDSATTAEEIQNTIAKRLNRTEQCCRVSSLRPAQRGEQNATVILDRVSARKLIEMERIKIGWIYCPVRERVWMDKCLRCWEIGHKQKECRGPDRSNLCRKCAQMGHQAKDCTRKSYCPACKIEGHQFNGAKCRESSRGVVESGSSQ